MFGLVWSCSFLLLSLTVSAILSLAMMGMPISLVVEVGAWLGVSLLVLAGGMRLAWLQVHSAPHLHVLPLRGELEPLGFPGV